VSAEAALAAGYALFLIAVALGLDLAARHSHRRSGRYRTAGFAFRADLDAWECPEGEFLRRIELDHSARLVRYRARAAVCNACPAKGGCTDSDAGREIAQPLDPWPHSEAGRFHRGISVLMLGLAALLVGVALARNTAAAEVALLGSAMIVVLSLFGRLLASFRASAANPPAAAPATETPLLPGFARHAEPEQERVSSR
jgi:hypothetical protein